MQRAITIGMLAAGLAGTAVYSAPSYCHMISSARSAQHYLQDLDRAGTSLNPVERFVFSLVLANSRTHHAQPPAAVRARRT
jgi:hypothetical protein